MSRTSRGRRPPIPPDRPLARYAGYVLLALAGALGQVRILCLLMPKDLVRSALALENVLQREPLWRVYQSRLLGPLLVHALGWVGSIGPAVAYVWFVLATLFAAGLCVMVFTDRLRDPARPPVASMLLFQLCVVLLLPSLWLYAWDLLSLLVFIVFNDLVLRGAGRWWFVLLYAVAVLNHELAFFIAGWLILDPLVRTTGHRRDSAPRPRFDWASLVTGAVMLVAGIAWVEGLRSALLIRESQPNLELPPQVIYGRSFHLALFSNLSTMARSLTTPPALIVPEGALVVVPLFLVLVITMAVRLAWTDWVRFGALAAVIVGMVASLLLFGLVYETRVLLPLAAFVAMHGWAVFGRRDANPVATG